MSSEVRSRCEVKKPSWQFMPGLSNSLNKGLVGGLLGIFGKEDGPPGVEGRIDIIMSAVDVKRMFGEGPGRHLHDHGGQFSGGVIILLQTVHNALARGEVHHPFARYRCRNGAP